MKTIDEIIEQLENLSNDDAIDIWDKYCEKNSLYDDMIYPNDEYNFNKVFSSIDDALRAAHFGEYDYTDVYFKLNAYGNLESMNYPKDYMDMDALAEYILDNNINI